MDQIAGEHSQAAVFAAEGKARHRLVRIAGAAGVALLASWLIALALGVLGGFDSLPGLPDSRPTGSNDAAGIEPEASHPNRAPQVQPQTQPRHAASSIPTSTTSPVSDLPSRTRPQSSTPETTPRVRISPSAPAAPTGSATNNGRHLGTTKTTTGKPIGSPGNGPGGSGPPGRLR
jgi:hypothetical protein